MKPTQAWAIEAAGLTRKYGAVRAVDDVSFCVAPGQVFGLLGPNGAGKTTTIKMICGLVEPTAGSVLVAGHDVVRRRRAAVRELGAVLEGGRNVYWQMSAWQNLIYFGRLKGLPGREVKPRARRLLTQLGLWEKRRQLVSGFSRGMQQKVAIAAALIADAPIVLLDEPTLGLDIDAARTVKEWIVNLAHDQGKAIVLTTHQLDVAEQLCDRIAIMRGGRLAADLPTRDLLDQYREDRYRVVLARHADLDALLREAGLPADIVVTEEPDKTVLTVPATPVHVLYDVLARLAGTKRPIESVTTVEPDLEEIFVRLVADG
jgi:ABC-2 type transport system ATP-binding protein